MALKNYIVIYWQGSHIKKFLLAFKRFFNTFLTSFYMLHIFKSSRFLGLLSNAYIKQTSYKKSLNLIVMILWILIIIFASFSRKIYINIIGKELIFIKFEDLFFILLMFLALIKIKDWKATPLDLPLISFVLICIFSIFKGIFINTVNQPIVSILYLLKILQYFLSFYLLFNFLNQEKEVMLYLRTIFITALLIGIYGIIEHFYPYPHYPFSYPFFYRIYERGYFYHEANHFAAYLMFIVSLIFGLFVYAQGSILKKIGLFSVFLFLCFPIFWTYSRGAYLALFLSLLIISWLRDKKIFLLTICAIILFLGLLAPASIIERIYSIKTAMFTSSPYSSSFAYRMQQVGYAWQTIKQHPFLGIGLGARERVFYENQFLLLFSEVGLLGVVAFLSIIIVLFKGAIFLYHSTKNYWLKGFSCGYIAGLTGLLLECNSLIIFFISRIMVPFWIITAIMFWFIKEEKRYEATLV